MDSADPFDEVLFFVTHLTTNSGLFVSCEKDVLQTLVYTIYLYTHGVIKRCDKLKRKLLRCFLAYPTDREKSSHENIPPATNCPSLINRVGYNSYAQQRHPQLRSLYDEVMDHVTTTI